MIIIFWKPFAAHQLVHLETHLVQHACQASLLLSIHRCDHFIQPCRWIDWGVPGCFDLRTHFGAYPLLWCLLWYIMFIFVTGLLGLKCYEGSCGIFGIPCPAKYYLKFLQYLMLFKSISVSFLDKKIFWIGFKLYNMEINLVHPSLETMNCNSTINSCAKVTGSKLVKIYIKIETRLCTTMRNSDRRYIA